METGESVEACLKRELIEEIGISFEMMAPFGEFFAPAVGSKEKILRMDVFLIPEWKGEPRASNEIEEIRWVDTEQASNMKMGSIFAHEVIPRLNSAKLIS